MNCATEKRCGGTGGCKGCMFNIKITELNYKEALGFIFDVVNPASWDLLRCKDGRLLHTDIRIQT